MSKSTFCKERKPTKYAGGNGYYSHIMTVKSFNDVENKKVRLGRIDIPILTLRGQCDNQKWGFAKKHLDLLPNSKLVIIKTPDMVS